MRIAVEALALLTALAWLPILNHFARSWRERRNPVSASICVLVAYAIYSVVGPEYYDANPYLAAGVRTLLDLVVCVHFYVAIWISRRRFHNRRSN